MQQAHARAGDSLGDAEIAGICEGSDGYAERFLAHLGARRTESIDCSDFECATVTHDMNTPISSEFAERYSAVFDGGSLEHIFNFPTAIRNCMEMVRVGGHYLAITPANNFFGHGFYQFSPELYFSVLSPENGFEIERMLAYEDRADAPWYAVRSPREVRGRVTLTNSEPVFLLVIARRTARKPIFEHTPQQSDYLARWAPDEAPAAAALPPASARPLPIRIAKAVLPASVRWSIRRALAQPPRPRAGFDPAFFEPMDPWSGA